MFGFFDSLKKTALSLSAIAAVLAVTDGQKLIWSDEFNDASLNTRNWNYEVGTGVNGDFGTGQLDRATDRAANVRIVQGLAGADGGALSITTTKERYIDRDYTSGRINTQGKVAVGPGQKLVARVWARDVRYKGQGFAFWLLPNELPPGQDHIMWPQGGEVDIMEYVGSIPNHNAATLHYAWYWLNNTYVDWNHGQLGGYYSYAQQQGPSEPNPGYGNYPPLPSDQSTGSYSWHTYGISWYKDHLDLFVDDNVYHRHYFNDGAAYAPADGQDRGERGTIDGKRGYISEYTNHFPEWHPFEHKMYMILSAGVGGSVYTYGGAIVPEASFPCSTFVDWVRLYELPDGGSTSPAPTSAPTTPTPSSGSCNIENGVDYVGNDVGVASGAKATDCCSACSTFAGAKAFTWVPGTCYCKSGKGATSANANLVSGTFGGTTTTPAPAPAPTTAAPGTCTLSADTNFVANDVGTADATAAKDCCTACKKFSTAKAFSFLGNTCYCKSAKGATNAQAGVTSGVFA